MFCVHHDEAEAVGVETVPCPFCGRGSAQDTAVLTGPVREPEDSQDALRHALSVAEEPSERSQRQGPGHLRTYW